jgi:hypothetical protein
MTDNTDFDDPMTANDAGGPGDTLRPAEALDPDEVRNRDGDEVVDPPEGWTEADKHGTSAREASEGESLDDKLAVEESDPSIERPDDYEAVDESGDTELLGDDEIDRILPDHHGRDRGQIDDTPEDGDSIFPVVD